MNPHISAGAKPIRDTGHLFPFEAKKWGRISHSHGFGSIENADPADGGGSVLVEKALPLPNSNRYGQHLKKSKFDAPNSTNDWRRTGAACLGDNCAQSAVGKPQQVSVSFCKND